MEVDEFTKLYYAKGTDPLETVKLFMIAVMECENDFDKGQRMVAYTIPRSSCMPAGPKGELIPYRGNVGFYLEEMVKNPNIIRSYLGGTPQNGYRVEKKDMHLQILSREIRGDEAKIIVKSGGKDFPTPITLILEKGYWKIDTPSIGSIATGVKRVT